MADIERKKSEISAVSHVLYSVFFTVLLIFTAILQCSDITFFGIVPDLSFAAVCAVGFIAGERYGGIFGLVGGVLIWALGSSGISLSPILFTFCGYLCGALPRVILRRNFLSYLVFTPIMGAIHIFFTLIYYIMLSESYDIWSVFGKRIIPEFFSCIIFMTVAYGAVKIIYMLFKGKKKDARLLK
ncbi:MAG: hypothetical protein ACI3X1_08000 [Eubacteriales bacterium]